MKRINLYLSAKETDGMCQILSRVTITKTNRPRIKTGVFIKRKYYSHESINIPKSLHPGIELDNLYASINQLETFCNRILLLLSCPESKEIDGGQIFRLLNATNADVIFTSVQSLKEELIKGQIKTRSILDYIDSYVKCRDLSDGRKKRYDNLKKYIVRFNTFQELSSSGVNSILTPSLTRQEDIDAFVHYISTEADLAEKYPRMFRKILEKQRTVIPYNGRFPSYIIQRRSPNTILSYYQMLRGVYNWLTDEKIIHDFKISNPINYNHERYLNVYYLTVQERNNIDNTVLDNDSQLSVQKDIFIFQCLVGCRYGDLVKLTYDNISNGIITYRPSKTRKHVNATIPRIPLSDRAVELIEKYRQGNQSETLFPFIKRDSYNSCIKRILKAAKIDRHVYVIERGTGLPKLVPLWQVASSHLARKTFVGNAYKVVKDPNIIGTMSGHVQNSISFQRYRDIDDSDRIEVISSIE